MTNQILKELGCSLVPELFLERTQELVEREMPIHPSITNHFELSFVNQDTRYLIDRLRNLTFSEYI